MNLLQLFKTGFRPVIATAMFSALLQPAAGQSTGLPAIPKVSLKKVLPAAERGDVQAIYLLASLYHDGSRSVKPDYRKSEKLFTICADQGIAMAQFYLAQMYYDGTQIPQNDALAFRRYYQAAVQGLEQAQYGLGMVYEEGRGTPKNMQLALRWYTQAANQGYAPAQNKLGDLYSTGDGVATNLVEAFKWYSLAATGDIAIAAISRDNLRKKMTAEEIDRAQRAAAAFTPTPHYNKSELKRQQDAILKKAREIRSGSSAD